VACFNAHADAAGAVTLLLGAVGVLGSLALATLLAQHFGLISLWRLPGLAQADLDSQGSDTLGSCGSLSMGSGVLLSLTPSQPVPACSSKLAQCSISQAAWRSLHALRTRAS
jgi:hypothetical protein